MAMVEAPQDASPPARPRVRCRAIENADRPQIFRLLKKSGFLGDSLFWAGGLYRLSHQVTPAGFPKYGYLLEVNGMIVGMLLLIAAEVPGENGPYVRCNVSTWFVWPAFRAYASLLVSQAIRRKDATYINISPLKDTFGLLAAQGFTRYCEGRFTAIPALTPRFPSVEIAPVDDGLQPGPDLTEHEVKLLQDHRRYNCLSLIATMGGRRVPFVLDTTRRHRVIGFAYLVWCRRIEDFVRLAGPLGRFLLRRGILWVELDANGPIPGLLGRYAQATPKYYKGPHPPRFGDVAYTERSVLGIRLMRRLEPNF